jgi:elongation factor G
MLVEAVAESDENLLDKFLAGEKFSDEEIIEGLRKGVCSGDLAPVFSGSALFLAGIDMFQYAIKHYSPSPKDKVAIAYDKEENEVEVACDETAPTMIHIFKTVADPFVGKMSYFKVLSGKIETDMTLVNARTGESEKIGKLLYVKGKKQEDAKSISAGDIGVVAKLSASITGDCLCSASRVLHLADMPFPKPTLMQAVVPKNKGSIRHCHKRTDFDRQ